MAEQKCLVVCFGEAMLRHSKDGQQIEQITPGGAEYNVACALANLGIPTRWVTSLPTNYNSELITKQAIKRGVELTIYPSAHPVGKYHVLEEQGTVLYERSNSAFANLSSGEINWREQINAARWLVISGITPLLSEGAKANWGAAMTFAELEGTLIALDLNHRPSLATFQELWSIVEPKLRQVNLLVISPDSLKNIMGNDSLEDLVEMRRRWNIPYLACTWKKQALKRQERWSAVAHSHGIENTQSISVIHEPADYLGGGDAWLAGFIDGLIEGIKPRDCCHRGDLLAALTQRTFGDLGEIRREELTRWESIEGMVSLLQDR